MDESNNESLQGTISYIYMENFVTYDSVCLRPGRNLNLIMGPNGTGKSTIVSAIVLGLGGKPGIIGRSLHVGEYVKAGHTDSKIEIHLRKNEMENFIVTRKFTSAGKSTFYINGNPENVKKVHELTTQLNIQMDNLCQFLPQDKVQDFSKMNAQELLENTEKSVGNAALYKQHLNLKSQREIHKNLEIKIASQKQILETKQDEYDGLQQIVRTIKERKRMKAKIEALNQKKAWMTYDISRKQLFIAKKERDKVALQMKKLESTLKPITVEISKMKSERKILEKFEVNPENKINLKIEKLRELIDEINNGHHRIKELNEECKNRLKEENNRSEEINSLEQQRCKLNNDLNLILQDIGTEGEIKQKQKKILTIIESHSDVIHQLVNKNNSFKQQCNLNDQKKRDLETELKSLNIDAKRLELLKRKSNDSYQGVMWLRQNKDKFSKTIYEPMLLNINLKNGKYSKYLENFISFRDLNAFVCEDKKDMNLLLSYLRDQNRLQVNAVHSDPFKNINMEPKVPVERIKEYGFTDYLISLFEAPSTIKRYLVSMYNLNNIPVGGKEVENNVDKIPNQFSCYFSENNLYSLRVSKYTGDKSVKMSNITGNGNLSIVMDRERIKNIEENIKALNEKNQNLLQQLTEIEEKLAMKNKELQKYRDLKNNCQHDLQQIETLKSKIALVTNKITELKREECDIKEIEEMYLKEKQVIAMKGFNILDEYDNTLDKIFKILANNLENSLKLKLLEQRLLEKETKSINLETELQTVENKFKYLDGELQPLKRETKGFYQAALETTNNISPQQKEFKPFNAIFSKLPATIEEINAEINKARNKIFCIGKVLNPEEMLNKYELLERDIKSLQENLNDKTSKLGEIVETIETEYDQWIKPLEALVDRINSSFSEYFASMNCAGEVSLTHGENKMDFNQYGLTIRVKFRDIDELQELTRQRQSGGERAVTTAIYMIALQELSHVPFRCVDEINQGMDAVNERRIFDILVKITTQPGSSQYFLLTPKLLPNLEYTAAVTIHCVFNGPFMVSHRDFNTKDYCKSLVEKHKRRRTEDD